MRHLAFPVTATRVGMVAECVVRAFWPFWSVLFVVLAPVLFAWHDLVAREWVWGAAALAGVALIAAFIWGLRRFRMPARAEAVARVDAALPGRPIAAIADTQAIGAGDAASEAVWRAHVARMEDRTKQAAFVEPDLRVADRDPYGLRFIALLFFVVALLFGSLLRVGSVSAVQGGPSLVTGPVWEGWVEPPAYTGKPSIYLNDIPAGPLRVPQGSQITLRLYGEVGALTVAESVSGVVPPVEGAAPDVQQPQQQFAAVQDGTLAIEGENGIAWELSVIADQVPLVELTGPIEADAMGEMSQPFLAMDDYGVVSGTATIALDLAAVTRLHGLAADPDPIDALVLDLPMPFTGDRTDFEEFLVDDLSEHPLANLPVTMTLEVVDAAGQTATSPAEPLILPGRRFFQPFAKAIIEQRRDLMWSRSNVARISDVMKAISHRPEGLFSNETTYLRMRAIIRQLDGFRADGITDEGHAEVVKALWDLAIQLEDGTLADARERLRRAQERLSEAMRDGASEEEIAELMQELREATEDYQRLLAEEQLGDEQGDGTDQADNSANERELGEDELEAMRQRIQELMEEGRMAEAEALLQQYMEILENLRMTAQEGSGNGPPSPGQQALQDLEDTLREQEDLSDDAFRELQERSNPDRQQGQQGQQDGQQEGQQGQQSGQQQGQGQQGAQDGQQPGQQGQSPNQDGQDGQQGTGQGVGEESQQGGQSDDGAGGEGSGADGRSLEDRQQALRDELQRQRDALPSLDGEAGEIAENSLQRAERAMEGAENALREGDLPGAIDRQAEALDALRNGMRSLNRALAENQSEEPGQGEQDGGSTRRAEQSERDPLGRELGAQGGQFGTEENLLQGGDVYRRAEELLNELRRRGADQERPEIERDYLRRLLDRF